MDPTNTLFFKDPITEDELLALGRFMQEGGGVLATGDHESLGSQMAGLIPRVRTMRKWFALGDESPYIPPAAPRNWPAQGPTHADTLRKDVNGNFLFTNQSDDIPQPLNLIAVPGGPGDHHPVFDIGGPTQVLRQYPDHIHEGETLGFGGVEASVPWTLDDVLTFNGESFTEYPNSKDGHQEKPQIIATGTVIPDHATDVDAGNKPCDSGFKPDTSSTEAKEINTLCVCDGYKVGVGRVLTDSSFHHFLDLNLIGDPCAIGEKTQGFDSQFLSDMKAFFINCVVWLANPRWLKQ